MSGRSHRLKSHRWAGHPGVRSGDALTAGERAADRLRNGMGSWIASELARHDYEADTHTRDVDEQLSCEVAALRAPQSDLLVLLADRARDNAHRGGPLLPTATCNAEDRRTHG